MKSCVRSCVREGGSLFPGMHRLGILSLLLLFLVGSAGAQVSTASINGVIRDPTGAVIPGATIVLTNVDTSVERTSTANKRVRMALSAYRLGTIPSSPPLRDSARKSWRRSCWPWARPPHSTLLSPWERQHRWLPFRGPPHN